MPKRFEQFVQEAAKIPESPSLTQEKLATETTKVFDGLVDYLRNKDDFPNTDINQLITLFWRLVANDQVKVAVTEAVLPTVGLAVMQNQQDKSTMAVVTLRPNFIDKVRENPLLQLGAIVYVASQARDFYMGRVGSDSQEILEKRSHAFESEALLAAKEISIKQDTRRLVSFNDYQRQIVKEFPKGLKSLPQGLNYPTLPFTPLGQAPKGKI